MLREILSSDNIVQKGKDSKNLNLETAEKGSSQFEKILKSIDKDIAPVSKHEVFDSLKSVFEDDKEFLQDSLKLLNSDKNTPFLGNEDKSQSEIAKTIGLHFGDGTSSTNFQPFSTKESEEEKLRILINKAKEYLRNELLKHSVSEKEMPKTLRGLVELAKSKGISLKNMKITLDKNGLETISENVSTSSQTSSKPSHTLSNQPQLEGSQLFIINKHSTESLLKAKSENIALKVHRNNPVEIADNIDQKSNIQSEKVEKTPTLQSLLSLDLDSSEQKRETTSKPQNLGDMLKLSNELEKLENKKTETKLQPTDKVARWTGVDKEIVSSLFSDEELRDLGIDVRNVKNRDSEEELLPEENLHISKGEGVKQNLELKIHEAKTMTRHLAMNLREQVENYKSPFQKLSLTLNPQRLGEVEVDIVKRGNSVKITLSGNAQTINILSANSFELRNQLVNVGLENPTFKFNEDGRNGSQQQQRENRNSDEVAEEEIENFEIEVLSLV